MVVAAVGHGDAGNAGGEGADVVLVLVLVPAALVMGLVGDGGDRHVVNCAATIGLRPGTGTDLDPDPDPELPYALAAASTSHWISIEGTRSWSCFPTTSQVRYLSVD